MNYKIIKNINETLSLDGINALVLENEFVKIHKIKESSKFFFDMYISSNIKAVIDQAYKQPSCLFILKTNDAVKKIPENIFLINNSIKNCFNFYHNNLTSFSFKLKESSIRKLIISFKNHKNFHGLKNSLIKSGFYLYQIRNKKSINKTGKCRILKNKINKKSSGMIFEYGTKIYYLKSLWTKKSNISNELITDLFESFRRSFIKNQNIKKNILQLKEKEIFLGNHIGEGLFVFDLSGKITLYNKMFENMFNIKGDDICLNQIKKIIQPKNINEIMKNWNNKLIMPVVYDEEIIDKNIKKNYSITYSPILDNNKIKNICAIIRDITLQKKLENELKISNINTALMNKKLISVQNAIIHGFSKLSEYKDKETSGHLERIQNYVKELAYELYKREVFLDFKTNRDNYLSEDYVEEISISSLLHDIGKVGIPDNILLKPERLTKNEFELMQLHTSIGGDTLKCMDAIVGEISILALAKDIAYFHHEKWNGSGYPFQMKQRDIPLCARIVSLCDVYDALTTHRPYKFSYSHEKACEIIYDQADIQFDPAIVTVFSTIEKQFKKIRNKFSD